MERICPKIIYHICDVQKTGGLAYHKPFLSEGTTPSQAKFQYFVQ